MIEAEVHQQLRAFLREQGESQWPHHLSMARLVARALRLGRNALMQTSPPSGYHGRYRLSYLMPALLWPEPVLLVVPEAVQRRLLGVEIPRLQQWIATPKEIRQGDRWPEDSFCGLLLTTPQAWLQDRLQGGSAFPQGIPTLLDNADDLIRWTYQQLTVVIEAEHWEILYQTYPRLVDGIRNARVKLTHVLFQHPPNPDDCFLLDAYELGIVQSLIRILRPWTLRDTRLIPNLPQPWHSFWQQLHGDNQLAWVTVQRDLGQFTLHCGPVEVGTALSAVWPQQPLVLIGGALDLDPMAAVYRQRVGLGELTSLKFSPDRHQECIQLYVPDGLPLPNTPQFQLALMDRIRSLLSVSAGQQGLSVLLINDRPLKTQVASQLAAEFGSRVQVEQTCLDGNGVLIAGWDFWRDHQGSFPAPQLLAIATLPIPSLEHPVVAGRVAYYKRLRQDWFRLYLLPEALSELQRAIAPVRERQGLVALLDSRVLHRSYGQQVFAALSPYARINYLEPTLFENWD